MDVARDLPSRVSGERGVAVRGEVLLEVRKDGRGLCAFGTQEFGGGQANAGRTAGNEDGFIFHNQVDALVCRQKWPWHSFSSPFLLSFSSSNLRFASSCVRTPHLIRLRKFEAREWRHSRQPSTRACIGCRRCRWP